MSILATLIYLVLQLLFLPLGIFGAIIVGYRQVWRSKQLGVSATAAEIIHGRLAMHWFGLRKDPTCVALANALPNTSPRSLFLCLFPLYIRYQLTGQSWLYPKVQQAGEENIGNFIITRTHHFDRLLLKHTERVEQFVTLGSGYDTRSYGEFAGRFQDAQFFEVDQKHTLTLKRRAITQADIDASNVRYVEVDFATETLFDRLISEGYDPEKRTVFLMEGVTLYLPEAEVRRSLRDIQTHSHPDSVLIADFYATRLTDLLVKSKTAKAALEATNEGLNSSLDFSTQWESTFETFVVSEGLRPAECVFLGSNSEKGPFLCVAELEHTSAASDIP